MGVDDDVERQRAAVRRPAPLLEFAKLVDRQVRRPVSFEIVVHDETGDIGKSGGHLEDVVAPLGGRLSARLDDRPDDPLERAEGDRVLVIFLQLGAPLVADQEQVGNSHVEGRLRGRHSRRRVPPIVVRRARRPSPNPDPIADGPLVGQAGKPAAPFRRPKTPGASRLPSPSRASRCQKTPSAYVVHRRSPFPSRSFAGSQAPAWEPTHPVNQQLFWFLSSSLGTHHSRQSTYSSFQQPHRGPNPLSGSLFHVSKQPAKQPFVE